MTIRGLNICNMNRTRNSAGQFGAQRFIPQGYAQGTVTPNGAVRANFHTRQGDLST